MTALTRFGATIFLCIALAACAAALLPAAVAPQLAATVGVAGIAAASCTVDSCELESSRCNSPNDKSTEVTEGLGIDVPANEGKVAAYAPAYWQPQFVSQGASLAGPAAEPTAGALAVTDKSIVFAPPGGIEGLRLPLVGVVRVELQHSATTGAPRQLTVESCFGRLDRFTFGQTQMPRQLDSAATAAAAAEIRARIAAARTAARN